MNSPFGNDGGASRRAAVEALYTAGFRLQAEESYREASALFRAMVQAAPTDERGWLALGHCHERLGQLRIALELYSAGSIAAEPAPRCLLSRFRALYDLNRTSDADDAFDKALHVANAREDAALVTLIENERVARP